MLFLPSEILSVKFMALKLPSEDRAKLVKHWLTVPNNCRWGKAAEITKRIKRSALPHLNANKVIHKSTNVAFLPYPDLNPDKKRLQIICFCYSGLTIAPITFTRTGS